MCLSFCTITTAKADVTLGNDIHKRILAEKYPQDLLPINIVNDSSDDAVIKISQQSVEQLIRKAEYDLDTYWHKLVDYKQMKTTATYLLQLDPKNEKANLALAFLYETGFGGERNISLAKEFLTKVAKNSSPHAAMRLYLYGDSQYSDFNNKRLTPKEITLWLQDYQIYRQAVDDFQSTDAMIKMGLLFENAPLELIDYRVSLSFYVRALSLGNQDAQMYLDRLVKRMANMRKK